MMISATPPSTPPITAPTGDALFLLHVTCIVYICYSYITLTELGMLALESLSHLSILMMIPGNEML